MESAARLLKVCVIGGGIAGLACAWSLVRRGHVDVEVFEAEGQLCSQASARNAAIYRPLEADPAITKLAWRNRLLLSDLAGNERLSLLRRTGILFLDDRSNSLQAHAKVADRFGIPWSWVEAPAARWPNVLGAMPTRYRGLYCPDGGVLDIHEIAERLRRSLQDAGVHVSLNERVSLKCRSDSRQTRVEGITTPSGRQVEASHVILAAGADAGAVLRETGLSTPLLPLRRHLALLSSPGKSDSTRPIIWQLHPEIYFRPEAGGVLISPCDESPSRSGVPQRDLSALGPIHERLSQIDRSLSNASVRCFWACTRTKSLDGRPLIGPDHRIHGLYWLAGLGGVGMSTALAAGEELARLVMTGGCRPEFCPQRFETPKTRRRGAERADLRAVGEQHARLP